MKFRMFTNRDGGKVAVNVDQVKFVEEIADNKTVIYLTEFKVAYGASLDAVRVCVRKFFPETDCESFIFVFFPFLFGVYPYSVATQKQLDAMRDAKMEFRMHSIYEIIYSCVMQLLGGTA